MNRTPAYPQASDAPTRLFTRAPRFRLAKAEGPMPPEAGALITSRDSTDSTY
jgi:hypothetical protein